MLSFAASPSDTPQLSRSAALPDAPVADTVLLRPGAIPASRRGWCSPVSVSPDRAGEPDQRSASSATSSSPVPAGSRPNLLLDG